MIDEALVKISDVMSVVEWLATHCRDKFEKVDETASELERVYGYPSESVTCGAQLYVATTEGRTATVPLTHHILEGDFE